MKLIRNRKLAILITVVVVVIATLIGVWGSLNKLARQAEAVFYSDSYAGADGINQRGIFSHLGVIANNTLGLASMPAVSTELRSEVEELLSARGLLISAMNVRDIRSMGSAFTAVQQAFYTLEAKLQRLEFSPTDKSDIDGYISSFKGASTAISTSSYNEFAAAYLDDASFLARIISPILYIKPPQKF